MTTLVAGDLHLNDNPRDHYRHEFQKQLRTLVKYHHIKKTIILGDLTDAKDYHSSWLVNEIVGHIDALASLCNVIVLKGNHDYVDPTTPFFKFLSKIPNVRWINEPTYDCLPFGGAWFLPHTNDYKRDWKDIFTGKRCEWIFAHATFEGAQVGPRRLDGIPLDIFPRNCKIISGDIHYPQTVGKNLTYVGAPYTCHFGDSYKPRVLPIGDNGEIRSILCQGVQKRLVKIGSLKELDKFTRAAPGDIVQIKYELPSSKTDKWPIIKNEIREWAKEHKYAIDTIRPTIERDPGATMKNRGGRKPDNELMEEYAKRTGAPSSVLKIGLELMKD